MNLESAQRTFIAESQELLDDMEEQLLAVEHEPEQGEMLNAIFRAAHTIKGSAGLFGLDEIVSFTHGVESILDCLRNGELSVSQELVVLLLECHDHIASLVALADAGTHDLNESLRNKGNLLSERLQQAGAATAPVGRVPAADASSEGKAGQWHIALRFGRDSLRDGMDPLSFIRYLTGIGEITRIVTLDDQVPLAQDMDAENCYLGFEIDLQSTADKVTIEAVFDFIRADSEVRVTAVDEPEAESQPEDTIVPLDVHFSETEDIAIPSILESSREVAAPVKRGPEMHSIRVDASKLDDLVNLIGELVIASAGMSINASASGQNVLVESASTINRLVEEVRDSALGLRMVPIGTTFNRFQRVVKDASRDLNKEINLVVTGADTELDKTVVEKISDPLMHLVRNAVDHGIEKPQDRIAKGKPPAGQVRLNAYHDSGNIVIEVSDDGGGLNRDKILQKAKDKGLVSQDQILEERDIFNLIFEPGFSTADQVSNLSGRGVGMDVVKRNITALRGSVSVDSEPGKGTRFSVRVPLTLAIIDGFLVGVENTSFVVPLDVVLECVELEADARVENGDNRYINLRGEVLPFISLREIFAIDGSAPQRESIVVFRCGDIKAGLVVDRLMGEFQTVIKPLGRIFSNISGVGGSTILGNGQVALILDVQGLVSLASLSKGHPEIRAA